MPILNKYKIFCNTENAWVIDSAWRESPLISCPNNTAHVINNESIIVDSTTETIVSLSGAKHPDGRPSVYATPRPAGTYTHFTSYGDLNEVIGQGNPVIHLHRPSQQLDKSLYLDFHTIDNKTFIHDAFVSYQTCQFDSLECHIVPKVQTYTNTTTGNFNIDPSSGIIIPAIPGTGLVDLTGHPIRLVEMTTNVPKFWDGTWDPTLKSFINLIPKPNGDGKFNMFTTEVKFLTLARWVFIGDGIIKLNSTDSERLGHGMRIKFDFSTYIDSNIFDHQWLISIVFHLFREKT